MTCRNCKHYSPLLGYCFGPTEAVYHTTSGNEACSAYEDGWKDEDPAYGEAIRWLLAVRNSSLRKRACRIVGDRPIDEFCALFIILTSEQFDFLLKMWFVGVVEPHGPLVLPRIGVE